MTFAGDELNVNELDGDTIDPVDENGWTFDFDDAGVGSELHLESDLVFTAGPLNIDLGANTTLFIDGDPGDVVDLTGIDLTILQTLDIVLADEVELLLTADQADGLDIVGVDTDGDGTYGTVNIEGLGDDPVDFSGIAEEIAGTITLEDDDVTCDPATDLGFFGIDLKVISNDDLNLSGQTIRFTTVAQAGRAINVIDGGLPYVDPITGDADYTNSSNVVWLFENIVSPPINTDEYDQELGRLLFPEALVANMGGDVESMFTSLPTTILRVDFADVTELDILLHSYAINRIFELASYTDIPDLTFSDEWPGGPPEEHIQTLTIKMGGEVEVDDLFIDDVVAPAVDPTDVHFDKLTIESRVALHDAHWLATEDYVNNNDGIDEAGEHVEPAALNTIGDIGVGPTDGIDLLDVEINTYGAANYGGGTQTYDVNDGADLSVHILTFDSAVAGSTALLTITGDNDVTFKSVDGTDPDITTVTVDTSGHSGVYTVTGGSPAMDLNDTETLNVWPGSSGKVFFGYEWVDADSDGIVDAGEHILNMAGAVPYAGVDGPDLSEIEVTGAGEVHLGVLAQIDGTDDDTDGDTVPDQDAFFLDGNGNTTTFAILGEGDVDGTPTSPFLAAGSTWTFDDVNLTISETTAPMFVTGGTLELNNVGLTIDGDVNLSMLVDDPLTPAVEGLVLSGTTTINVTEGSILRLTVEQVDALQTGLFNVTGEGTVVVTGESDDTDGDIDTDFGNLRTAFVDLSAVTLAAADADQALNVLANGALDAPAGTQITQKIIGSANDDRVELDATDDDITTIDVITQLGADGGTIGDPNDTPTGTPDPAEVPGDMIIKDFHSATTVWVIADEGFDYLDYYSSGDVFQVASGAEFYASQVDANPSLPNPSEFVAMGNTTNAGVAVLQDSFGGGGFDPIIIDVSAAGGTHGFSLIGYSSSTINHDTLIGSNQNDTINGGNSEQTTAAAIDILTGNGGADVFEFNIAISEPVAPSATVFKAAVDQELITVTADGTDNNDEFITITYSLNGVGGAVIIDNDPALNVTVANDVASAIAVALDNIDGVTASAATNTVTAAGESGNSFELIGGSATLGGTVDTLNATYGEGTDVANIVNLTIDAGVTVGEKYSVLVTLAEGQTLGANYTAAGGDGAEQVATGLAAAFNAVADTSLPPGSSVNALAAGGVITFQDEVDDDGGFTLTSSVEGALTGTGASDFGATDLATADIITDFTNGTDKVDIEGMAAGSATNYLEAPEYTDFATAQAAADAAFDSTVVYYMTSMADDPGTTDIVESGLLFFDANADGNVDGVIQLLGVDADSFAAGDIIA